MRTWTSIKDSLPPGSGYEAIRNEWLRVVQPGDFGQWTTFDGSTVIKIVSVDSQGIDFVFHGPHYTGAVPMRYSRDGMADEESYGFRNRIGPVSDERIRRVERDALRYELEQLLPTLELEDLRAALDVVYKARTDELSEAFDPAI